MTEESKLKRELVARSAPPALVLRVGERLVAVPESGRDLAMVRYVEKTVMRVARETQDIDGIAWITQLCVHCCLMVGAGVQGKVTVAESAKKEG